MFSRQERDDNQRIFAELARNRGTYRYLCLVGGVQVYTHQPVGQVLRCFT
jgi:hypothetical protein